MKLLQKNLEKFQPPMDYCLICSYHGTEIQPQNFYENTVGSFIWASTVHQKNTSVLWKKNPQNITALPFHREKRDFKSKKIVSLLSPPHSRKCFNGTIRVVANRLLQERRKLHYNGRFPCRIIIEISYGRGGGGFATLFYISNIIQTRQTSLQLPNCY